MRGLLLHQKILHNQVDSLKTEITSLAEQISAGAEPAPEVLIELAVAYAYYGKTEKAKEVLSRAKEAMGIQWELTGKLGRRSKYQVEPTPQLVLNVEGPGTANM